MAYASTQYTYDDLHRLTSIERDDGSVIYYIYDELGNRTLKVVTVPDLLKGDVDGNSDVNLVDAILALQVSSNAYIPAEQTIKTDGDANNDNQIGLEEAIYALREMAGLN